jgi:uroporphyrinogen-III synthase
VPTAPATSSPEPSEDRDVPRGVLVTRPRDAALETATRLERLGWEPVIAPCLVIASRAIADPPPCDAILVTSRNGLDALPASLHGVTLLAVGDATAARARGLGFRDVRSAAGDAAALAALAAATLPQGARVLQPAGAGQGAALEAQLTAGGFAVHRRVAYEAVPAAAFPADARVALRARRLGAATFLSAETARAFAQLLPASLRPLLAGVDALAISEATASALCTLPWRRVRVSATPDLDGILALL